MKTILYERKKENTYELSNSNANNESHLIIEKGKICKSQQLTTERKKYFGICSVDRIEVVVV